MDGLQTRIDHTTVSASTVQVWWLGGAGFAFKTAAGQVWLLSLIHI